MNLTDYYLAAQRAAIPQIVWFLVGLSDNYKYATCLSLSICKFAEMNVHYVILHRTFGLRDKLCTIWSWSSFAYCLRLQFITCTLSSVVY